MMMVKAGVRESEREWEGGRRKVEGSRSEGMEGGRRDEGEGRGNIFLAPIRDA